MIRGAGEHLVCRPWEAWGWALPHQVKSTKFASCGWWGGGQCLWIAVYTSIPPINVQSLRLPKRKDAAPDHRGAGVMGTDKRPGPGCGGGRQAWVRISTSASPGEGYQPPSPSRRPEAAPTPTR